ncbi:hypothetical protein [Denitratisoma sp. DHT3]|uniref:hypothetical protein n=1 Tax=Denitratisoma sp. DHT3 TaxID=1981880 RepID=UPI0028F703EB|nr:hypothetical protein [Denitratisoma sp. DHT3]
MTTMKITSRLLDHAGDALTAMLRFEQPADAVLSRIFRDHRDLGHRERGFVADLTYGVLRRRWAGKALRRASDAAPPVAGGPGAP